MKTKKEILEFINATKGTDLTHSNCSYAKINKSKAVWWINVASQKFDGDFNLLLKTGEKVIWVHLPKGFVKSVVTAFRIRPDKGAVDLEISANDMYMYLCDIKSGGTGFNFNNYIKEIISY
ncbi:MAG: hypothetical protein ACI9Z3_001352 [Roseivirga sp.]|jgi:hypothetical protein